MKRYIGEKISIMKMHDHLNNPGRCPELVSPYGTRWPSVLRHRLWAMDTGVADTRIGGYIQMIDMMINERVIVANEVLHVLEQGIAEEDTTAFKVIYNTNMLVNFPCIDSFVRRVSEKYSALASWQVKDIHGMTPLVKYHLDKQTEEPLLEWLTVWQRKGFNICKHVLGLTEKQQVQMQFLCKKQQSPEMRLRRMNSLRYNIYSDQVMCAI